MIWIVLGVIFYIIPMILVIIMSWVDTKRNGELILGDLVVMILSSLFPIFNFLISIVVIKDLKLDKIVIWKSNKK